MIFYHATYQKYLPSIKQNGLLCRPPQHNWTWGEEFDANGGGIFLSLDLDAAIDFCEAADNECVVSNEMTDNIIVFMIEKEKLKNEDLHIDIFSHPTIFNDYDYPEEEAVNWIYQEDIPFQDLIEINIKSR